MSDEQVCAQGSTALCWVQGLLTDFGALTPTAQVTWVITLGGAVIGVLFFLGKQVIRRRAADAQGADPVSAAPVPAGGETGRADLLRLIAEGEATVAEATELARALYAANAGAGVETGEAGGGLDAIADGDDERRSFTSIVAELATSETRSDREVVLQYARGDHGSAMATLERRAAEAGREGAPIWREVAALARPRDHRRAIEALRKVVALDPSDVVSMCRLARVLTETDAPQEASEVAQRALLAAPDAQTRARALIQVSRAEGSLGRLGDATASARRAVEEARAAAAANPADRECARMLGNAFERLAATHSSAGALVDASEGVDNAIRIYRALLDDDAEDEDTLLELTHCLFSSAHIAKEMGDLRAAVAVSEEALAHVRDASARHDSNLWLANAHAEAHMRAAFRKEDLGATAEAQEHCRQAEALARRTTAKDDSFGAAWRNLIWARLLQGRILRKAGDFDGEEAIHAEVLRMARKNAEAGTEAGRDLLAVVLSDIGDAALEAGDTERADEMFEESTAIFRAVVEANPTDIDARKRLVGGIARVGNVAVNKGDYARYRELAEENHSACRDLVASNPGGWEARSSLAYALDALRVAANLQENDEEADDFGAQGMALYAELSAANPTSIGTRENHIDIVRNMALQKLRHGHIDEAEKLAQDSLSMAEALAAEHPDNANTARFLCITGDAKAKVLAELGDFDGAMALRDQNVASMRADVEAAPQAHWRRRNLMLELQSRAELLSSVGRHEAALTDIEEAETYLRTDGNQVPYRDKEQQLVLLNRRASYLNALDRKEEAHAAQDQSHEIAGELVARHDTPNARRNYAAGLGQLAARSLNDNALDEAETRIADYEAAIEKATVDRRYARGAGAHALELRFILAQRRVDATTRRDVLRKIVAQAEEDAAMYPRSLDRRTHALDTRARLAALLVNEDSAAAREVVAGIEEGAQALARDFPENPSARASVADLWHRLAYVAKQDGQVDVAVRYAEAAVAGADALVAGEENPRVGIWRRYNMRLSLSDCLVAWGKKAEARATLVKAEALLEVLLEDQKTPDAADDLRRAYLSHAVTAHMTDDLSETFAALVRECLALARAGHDRRSTVQTGVNLITTLNNLIFLCLHEGDGAKALILAQEAMEITQAVAGDISDRVIADSLTANARSILAAAHNVSGDPAQARPLLEAALGYYEAQLSDKRERDDLHMCASVLLKLGDADRLSGDAQAAQARYTRALDLLADVRETAPQVAGTFWDEVECWFRRAQAGGGAADMDRARAAWTALVEKGQEPPIDLWVRAFRQETGL